MSVQIIAKTAPIKSQIEGRLDAGFDMFEVQLLDMNFSVSEICNVFSRYYDYVDVCGIHTSLTPNGNDITLSSLIFDPRSRDSFLRTCELASQFVKNKPVEVVIHNDIRGDYLENHSDYLSLLGPIFAKALSFHQVNIGIENTVGVVSINEKVAFREGTEPMDTPAVVRFLRKSFDTDRFGFVFDIGHYAIMRKLIRFLTDACFREYTVNPDLEEIWQKSSDVISTIHLSAIQGFGYGVDHGKPFCEWEPRDRAFIKRILTLYESMPVSPNFVVEVKETDYDKCWNLEHTANTIETVLNEMHPDSLLGDVTAEKVFIYPDDEKAVNSTQYVEVESVIIEEV